MSPLGKIDAVPVKSRGDWLCLRRRDVTASDIPALFGIHPYRTPLQVFADKTGNGVDRGDNQAMRRGRILEPAVAAAVSEDRPDWAVIKANEYLRSETIRIGATPDYYFMDERRGGPGCLEIKTAEPEVFQRDWVNGVPLYWVLQNLTQQILKEAVFGAVAVMVMTRQLPVFIYDVPRHPAAEAKILKKVPEFWDMVNGNTPPPPDFAKDGEAIAAMFPRERAASLDLSTDNRIREILERRVEISAGMKAYEDEKEAINAELKQKLGENEAGTLPGWSITWKTQKEHTKHVKATRVLRVNDLRNKEKLS